MITFKGRNFYEQNTLFSISRLSNAYEPVDSKVVAPNQPRYDIGKFGFGLKLEEGTTNLVPNPSFEAWNGGLPVSWFGSADTTITQVAGRTTGSAARLTATVGGNQSLDRLTSTSGILAVSTQYTITFWAKQVTGTGQLGLAIDSTGTFNFNVTSSWQQYTLTVTTGSSSSSNINFYPNVANDTFDIDDVQVEQKAYATSFANGYRDNEVLTIPVDATKFTADHFTLEMWIYPTVTSSGTGENYLASINNNGSSTGRWDLKYNTSTKAVIWEFYDGTTTVNFSSTNALNMNAWNYVAWGYDRTSNTQYVNVNGTKTSPATPATLTAFVAFTQMLISADYNKSIQSRSNFIVDDIRVSNIARTDADITTSSSGTAPMVADANTTIKLSSDFPNSVYLNGNTSL